MSTATEIAPDVYRLSTYVPELNLQFNQFLVKDDEPLLYHSAPGPCSRNCWRPCGKSSNRRRFAGSASAISRRTNAAP